MKRFPLRPVQELALREALAAQGAGYAAVPVRTAMTWLRAMDASPRPIRPHGWVACPVQA